jgi:hypothetical protein
VVALVVAAGAEEEEEAVDELDPAPALALLASSTIPPCTVVGVTVLAFAAAALYAAMVEPDLHRYHISKNPSLILTPGQVLTADSQPSPSPHCNAPPERNTTTSDPYYSP